jgi:hypothetical protein
MEFHKYANLFPLMTNEEHQALAASISENGLEDPIVTHEGRIPRQHASGADVRNIRRTAGYL